jgi:hypothetical protein
MHSNPTPNEVLDLIDKGIRKAQRDYKDAAWTPLCYGPEYLITIISCKEINK